MNYICRGTSKNGRRCSKRTKQSLYCHYHRNQFNDNIEVLRNNNINNINNETDNNIISTENNVITKPLNEHNNHILILDELEKKKEENAKLKQLTLKLLNDIKALEKNSEQLKTENNELTIKTSEHSEIINNLRFELRNRLDDCHGMKDEIMDTRRIFKLQAREIECLRSNNKSELLNIFEEKEKDLKEVINKHAEISIIAMEAIDKLMDQTDKLKGYIHDLVDNDTYDKIVKALGNHEVRISNKQMKQKIEELTKEIDYIKIDSGTESETDDNKTEEQKLKTSQNKIKRLQAKLSKLRKDYNDLLERNNALKHDYEELDFSFNENTRELTDLKQENSDLYERFEELNNNNMNIQDNEELNKLNTKINEQIELNVKLVQMLKQMKAQNIKYQNDYEHLLNAEVFKHFLQLICIQNGIFKPNSTKYYVSDVENINGIEDYLMSRYNIHMTTLRKISFSLKTVRNPIAHPKIDLSNFENKINELIYLYS